jgi:hypothetical protein
VWSSRLSRLRNEREFLQKEFEIVKKEFSPRLRKRVTAKFEKNLWCYDFSAKYIINSLGQYDPESRTISINTWEPGFLFYNLEKLQKHLNLFSKVRLTQKQSLHHLLIHEICHAIIEETLPHGKKWRERMLKASQRAYELGRMRLARKMLEEVKLGKLNEKAEKKEVEEHRKFIKKLKNHHLNLFE